VNATLVCDAAYARVITTLDRRRLGSLLLTPLARRSEWSAELGRLLSRALVVPRSRIGPDVVTMNSIVVCSTHGGDALERKLVYPWDADDAADQVSVLSPLGLALLGSRVGARLPDGLARSSASPWGISRLLYQPEEAGDRYR
jgi:regulator of nucleoside diphosphate kinase